MKITSVSVKDLIQDPDNARLHSNKNLDAIKASLRKFDQVEPLIVQRSTNIVIGGNGRLAAMRELGIEETDVHYVDVDNTTARALGIALNRTAETAAWDMDVLGDTLQSLREDDWDLGELGFDDSDLGELDLEDKDSGNAGLTDPDEVPEDVEPVCKAGQIWKLGDHRLMCGDSTDKAQVDRLMNGEKADMVFTDPPYGVSYTDKNEFLNGIDTANRLTNPIENDHNTVDEMYELWCKVFNIVGEVMGKKSSFYICSPQGGELMMMMMMQAIYQSPLSLKHSLIWVKNNHVLGRCDYNYKHEPILYGWLKKGSHNFYGKGECKTSVWPFDKPLKNDLHPTMKPIALVEEALLNSSINGQSCFEPFCGSGPTLIACEKTGRKCYGMEIDPHYCDVIIKRWEDFSGKKAELIG